MKNSTIIFILFFCLVSFFSVVLAWNEPSRVLNVKNVLTSSHYNQEKRGDLGVYTLYDLNNNVYFLNLNGAFSMNLAGGLTIKDSNMECTSESEGALKFSKNNNILYLCDGNDWKVYYEVKVDK